LQKTRFDNDASLRIFAKCDDIMKLVCQFLQTNVPEFTKDNMVDELQAQINNIKINPKFK